jgi:tetratricopeptide (TPR) repeat protein
LAIAATLTAKDLEDPAARSAAARSHERMGDLLGPAGDRAGSLEHYRTAIAASKGDPLPTLRVLTKVAQMQSDGGDPAAALESYREGERTAQALAAKNPDENGPRNALAFVRERVAWYAVLSGQPEGAEDAIRAAIATYEAAAPTPRSKRNLAMAYKTMAEVEKRAGKTAEALQSLRKSLDISQALLAADPKNSQFSIDIVQEKVLLIDLLLAGGQREEARKETASTLAWLKPLAHAGNPSLYYLTDYLSLLDETPFPELTTGEDAVALARHAVEMTGKKDSETLDLLARALKRAGNFEEAAETEKQALALLPPAQSGRPVPETRQKLQATLDAIQTASASRQREGK